jgi:membrane fusion protein (multidrug efflux system)
MKSIERPFFAPRAGNRFTGRLGLCLLVLAAIFTGCDKKPAAMPAMPPPEVSVQTVTSGALPVTTVLPGRIDAIRTAQVSARVAGILTKIVYEQGADVKAGDVMFQIDPAPLHALYDSAAAALAKSNANLTQTQQQAKRDAVLVKIHAVSQQAYDNDTSAVAQGEADVLAAKANVETAAINLGYATVTAPISGRSGQAIVTEGALVGQGSATQMATIQQLDPIYFDFTESSVDLLQLKKHLANGQLTSLEPGTAKITLLLEDGSVYPQIGKLLFSDVTVDPTTGMVTLRAIIPNPDGWLLPGMFARGRLEQGVNTNAITVSQRAVTYGANGDATVLVVTPDNKVEVRPVQTDYAQGDQWIVTSGLKAGERVIVEGSQKIRPGMTVNAVPFGTSTNAVK